MRKNLGYIAISYFIFRASTLGLASFSLTTILKQDAWLGALLGILFGIFPIILFYKIADCDEELTILEKVNKLFPKGKYIINILLGLFILLFSILNFWNLSTFIKSQFLSKTPIMVVSISLIIPIVFLLMQKNKVIARVSFVLFILSFLFTFSSMIGLFDKIELNNIMPILENNPTKGILTYISYCVLPIFMILIFPNKYVKKSIIIGYMISSTTILISLFLLISILGIDLVLLFQYSEFQILKLIFEGVLSIRVENFLSLQWIFDLFIFITIGIKYTTESFNIKNHYVIPLIVIIINNFLFPNTILANKIITSYFPYIVPIFLLGIPLIIYIKQKKRNKNFLKNKLSNYN